jgi:hypothetical protein
MEPRLDLKLMTEHPGLLARISVRLGLEPSKDTFSTFGSEKIDVWAGLIADCGHRSWVAEHPTDMPRSKNRS